MANFIFDKVGELAQADTMVLIKVPGLMIQHAKRAQSLPPRTTHHSTRVKANVRVARDQWVTRKAGVIQGIRNHQQRILVNGVPTEGNIAGALGYVPAQPGFKPLPIAVQQSDQYDGKPEHTRHQAGITVKTQLRGRVQKPKAIQLLQAFLFPLGNIWRNIRILVHGYPKPPEESFFPV